MDATSPDGAAAIGSSMSSRRCSSSSAATSSVSVPTPSRDLSLRQGAFARNILRLEQSAEEMSAGGSDIGEEIRKMNELERANSRDSSRQNSVHRGSLNGLQHSHPVDVPRSRAGSYANSIVDVNGSARAGGYSPGGFLTSPVGSQGSGSWALSSMNRRISSASNNNIANSFNRASRFGQMGPAREDASAVTSQDPSRSSFALRYDEIASQIENPPQSTSQPLPVEHALPTTRTHGGLGISAQTEEQGEETMPTPPLRPGSADTFQQAQAAFEDFDGVHYAPSHQEPTALSRTPSAHLSVDAASLLPTPLTRPYSFAAPPPNEGMVYYPAPVPRMLNLPKRLSQLPAANVQAKRRTQVLNQLPPPANRASSMWLPQTQLDPAIEEDAPPEGRPISTLNPRMNVNNRLSNIPAQLRASAYFDHQSVEQDVQVERESAVATLDSILAASATAPVSAFTDHPFAGDVSKLLAPERQTMRRSTATILTQSVQELDQKKRRSSLSGLLRRTLSNDELTNTLNKRRSRSSTLLDFGQKVQKRNSQMSLGDDLDQDRRSHMVQTPTSELDLSGGLVAHAQNATASEDRRDASTSRPATAMSGRALSEGELIEHDFVEGEEQEVIEDPEGEGEGEDGEASFVQPSTLLAELQVRKAQLKSRTRTAATAFPNGMHSTLLELDAVAAIDKKNRSNKRIALAWEDPSLRQQDAHKADEDDEVPLGIMFPSKNGLANRKVGDDKDWNRPLGLMERREMEDNEPLSSRRSRLRGEPIQRPRQRSPEKFADVDEEDEKGNEDESLAHRVRRLKSKDALDTAISDVAPRDGSRPLSTFTDEVMTLFGVETKREEAPPLTATAEEIENETLGQRRARLQREREAAGDSNEASKTKSRPSLQSRNSMSNLLSAHPVGPVQSPRSREPQRGTLLFASAQAQADQKRNLQDTNRRNSSYGVSRSQLQPQQQTSRTAALPQPSNNPYFASPTMPFAPKGSHFSQMQYGQQQMMYGYPSPQLPYGAGMQAYPNMNPNMAMHMGMGGVNMAMPGMPPMMLYPGEPITSQQREAIDRWRMSVAQ